MRRVPSVILLLLLAVASCATQRKLSSIRKSALAPALYLPSRELGNAELKADEGNGDSLVIIDSQGQELKIMRAVRDVDGQMVATERLGASIVTASFKNVAERHGRVELRFKLFVPDSLMDSKWQIRLTPRLYVLGSQTMLEPVLITGSRYRKQQLRGYQLYERFIDSIITDSTAFINVRDLEIFLKRNIPELYRIRTDTSFVSDSLVETLYGVSRREAAEHYRNNIGLTINRKKQQMKDVVFRYLVKSPIIREGIRQDMPWTDGQRAVSYEYVQTIEAAPKLRKAVITLSGGIYDADQRIYEIPECDSLTYYISSLSTLVDGRERFKKKILERRLTDNSVCWIEFVSGRWDVNPELGHNGSEMGRIKSNIRQLIENEVYDMDSIVVTASSSPEGSYSSNRLLSERRSESVCRYFDRFVKAYGDSASLSPEKPLKFIPKSIAENWTMLERTFRDDSLLSPHYDEFRTLMRNADPDIRERRLSEREFYPYLRKVVYPHLRTVRFDFFLHRKGVVKDTIQTMEVDSLYMSGVEAIRNRDYVKALDILRPYSDFNTAVAYCSLDMNESALSVLERIGQDEKTEYMKAVLYSRKGDEPSAVSSFLKACRLDPSFIHRGNLDPEISILIKKYNLTQTLFEK